MKVFYSRISSNDGSQNDERQLQNLKEFDYVLSDKCSGTIPLWERPKGSQIKKLITENKLKELHIHSIDRLGRSTIDVLSIWKELTEKGIRVVCRNPNFQNITDEGKTDMFSELMISILSTMSDFERKMIRERQMEGIRIRKEKGLYKGRQIGTTDSIEKFLNKPKSKDILRDLDNGYGIREISEMRDCSFSTIYKTKRLSEELVEC
jgi:DNA invertase Pin-like site-specific DNA recombinase|tara:strand:- start:25 stop:645 length:621 start_codon:yes stop_codon:yes gene_type:complete